MKKIFLFITLLIAAQKMTMAQNVGIGTTEPMNKMHIVGSLLVNTPTSATSTPPTAAQTKNMPGLGTQTFLLSTDSTGRLYDSGGPSGNYGIDHDGKVTIALAFNIAIEVTAETMDLSIGDSLIIKESSTGLTLLAVGNGYSTTGKWIFNSSTLYINFKSNTDFNTGAGFSLLFRRLYSNVATLPGVNGYTGSSFLFDVRNGLVRSGHLNNAAMGGYSSAFGYSAVASGLYSTAAGFFTNATGQASVAIGNGAEATGPSSAALGWNTTSGGTASLAMGRQTIATGDYSTAMGFLTGARGDFSTAMGVQTAATGQYSTAMGNLTFASGIYSTAIGKYTDATGYAATAMGDSSLASGLISFASGFRTTASGDYSTAMGRQTFANGDFSTAIGNNVSTNNQAGSFVIGDNSSASVMLSPASNFFMARFAGGYRLVTSSNLATGCNLNAGDNAWTTGSDVRTKENFAAINGEEFLKKIAGFHLTSWNYKTQNPASFRHYGPMAQDFYAAFGKDKYGTIGNDTTINSADFAGVSFIAIQALEKRTAVQQQELEQYADAMKKETVTLKAIIQNQQKQLDELKALVNRFAANAVVK
jgi:Head domain of trimeric autotransporter adhesin/Chaperone of endosialidase